MKVKELIEFLQTKPQNIDVGFRCYSEFCLLEEADIGVVAGGVAREDGWIHEARPDKETVEYLMFPGN